jgi:hypothetical protein
MIVDKLVASMGAIYGNGLKFFSAGSSSPPVGDLVQDMRCSLSSPDECGEYHAKLKLGEEEIEVPFSVERWAGREAPTLLFHHGSGDIPYTGRIKQILKAENDVEMIPRDVNVIATCSPYNHSKREYIGAIRNLKSFCTLLAGSAVLIEGIRNALPRIGRFVVSGISLGGWITNLHHAYFDTADEYRPVFAGAALDALFTDSAYSRLTAADAHPDSLSACLNFETEFDKRPKGCVYPLLARYDQYIKFERQAGIYRPENISVIEKGHVTGSADSHALLNHLAGAFGGNVNSRRSANRAPAIHH